MLLQRYALRHIDGLDCTSSCRQYTFLRDVNRSQPKGFIRGNTKIGPVLEVDVTNHLKRNGLDIKIDCIQKTGLNPGWLPATLLTQT